MSSTCRRSTDAEATLEPAPAKAGVAIDRATRFVYLEILADRRVQTAAGFLHRFLDGCPLKVHTILTDNGSEFTGRFAVDKKNKPLDKPSGQHPFDLACAKHAIKHRLTRPFRPQTNGMVERFNRRLGEQLDRMPQNRAAHHRRFRGPCRTRRLPPHLRRR